MSSADAADLLAPMYHMFAVIAAIVLGFLVIAVWASLRLSRAVVREK